MPKLQIRFKKNKDGSAALTCVRADGSSTWQRQEGQLGAVFPPHDLTHFAVETVLRYDDAFYGLIADGWEISDFSAPFPRGPLPVAAREVEVIVGALDLERTMSQRGTAEDFNEQLRFAAERDRHGKFSPRIVTEDELTQIRASRSDLFRKWWDTSDGDTLELTFPR
jgi:hypothetical protein